MSSSLVKNTHEHLVLIGIGFSGIEFLKEWLKKPIGLRVTVIGEQPSDFFYLNALCSLKGLNCPFSCEPEDKSITTFRVSTIEKIDFENKCLLLQEGSLPFDILIVVNEPKPKSLFHQKRNLLGHLTKGDEYINWIQESVKEAVVSGDGFVAIALVEQLQKLDFKVTLVSNESRLAKQTMPEEEACLIAKKLKASGVQLIFNEKINDYLLGEGGEIIGVRLVNGKELPCQVVVHDKGNFPDFFFLRGQPFYSGETCRVSSHYELDAKDGVFAIGQNLEVFERDSFENLNIPLSTQGITLARYLKENWVQVAKTFEWKDPYQLAGLEWCTYGDFSSFWGNNSHNFYWEHPNGEIAIRLLFHRHDFSILALATLGINFDQEFLNNAFTERCKALDFINKMRNEVFTRESSEDMILLISKAFAVEFKGLKNENRTSLFGKIFAKFL